MSAIQINCFKAYDVRGRVPDQINEDIAYRIGRAFVQFLQFPVMGNRPQTVFSRSCKPHADLFHREPLSKCRGVAQAFL